MKSIISSGMLKTDEVQITKSETFDKIALALKNDRFRNAKIRDILANFDIKDGRVTLRPFTTKIGSSGVTIGGDQGLDKTLNYSMLMSLPRNEFGSAANDVYESLVSQAASKGFDLKKSDNVNVNVKITGTFTDPKIGLDVRESLTQAKAEIKERLTEEVSKVKEDVTEKANAEIDRIMKEAEGQAEKVKAVAKESGERLVGEAKLQGQNLIKEAGSNPLKKAVAEKTAAGMVTKAQQKADALNKEAEEKAAAIMQEAQKKADALKK